MRGYEPPSKGFSQEENEESPSEKRQDKRPRSSIVIPRASTPPPERKGNSFKAPAEKGGKGGKGKGKGKDAGQEGEKRNPGGGTSKDTAGTSKGTPKDLGRSSGDTEVTDLTETEDSPSEKGDPPQGRPVIVFYPSSEVAPGEKYPGEHFIPEEDPKVVSQVLETIEKLYQAPVPSDGFHKFPQVAAALNDYRVALHTTVRHNNHSASNKTAVEHLAKVRVNSSRGVCSLDLS